MVMTIQANESDRERAALALEVSQVGTFRWDIENNDLHCDIHLCDMLGLNLATAPSSYQGFLDKIHPRDRMRIDSSMHEMLRTERDMDVVVRVVRPDGQVAWFNDKARVFHDQSGRRYVIGACTEITAYKNVEEELIGARDAADQANRTKNLFLASVSHELRTPLTAIIGFADLLSKHCMDDEYASKYLEVILKNGRHLTAIVSDILDFASTESGSLAVAPTEVHIASLLSEIRLMFEDRARSKGLSLVIREADALPSTLYFDQRRFKQVMINLLDNALKFTLRGRVEATLDVTVSETDPTKCHLIFVVSDTGIGIREDLIRAIFQPFVQGENTYSRQFGGTGLGLALSRALARSMGGDVTLVQTQVNGGSTFRAHAVAHSCRPASPTGVNRTGGKACVIH